MSKKKSKKEVIVSSFNQLFQPEAGVYVIPEGTTEIQLSYDHVPFYKKLEIPASVTHIEGLTYVANCSCIDVHPDNPAYCSIDGVVFSHDHKMLVAYPQAGAPMHHNKLSYNYHVPIGTQVIADDAFAGNHTLETITLPDGLTDIGSNAFANCTSLFGVNIPSSVVHIGMYCFDGSNRINRLYFPSQVKALYTSNLSSGIVIEVADGVSVEYDAIPVGFSVYDTFSHGTPRLKPILLCRNNPDIVAFAERADYRCIQDYSEDANGLIWHNRDLLCFPHAWPSDQYALPAKTDRVYAGAFAATQISYFYSVGKVSFFPLYTSSLFDRLKSKAKWAYKVHPGAMPENSFLPDDNPYFFVTADESSYARLMNS